MRYAVISDVHGNLEALKAVLKDIKKKKIADIVFLGDAVGYGPDPDECINILNAECQILLAGNHDHAVLGLIDIDFFNPYAKAAILWTKEKISKEHLEIMRTFPIYKEIENKKIFLVHSTPKEPESWHYLLTLWDAEVNFHYFDNKICLLGHSHQPFIIERILSGEMRTYKSKVGIGETERYIINVGSVGQPRDGDPRACYAIIDDISVELFRVEYNIKKTQDKMRIYGLPFPLIERLTRGV
ncbi:metallophosphatase family protein [Dissulfurispira thermophila]|uniref:Metallophosphatase family protein n=2 Tax=root TaxID=1 RepID=A0A7G1H5P9_9BACT|nr:metallophosphoesterase family protein [Dissulfurispira thermophila]BCB97442.1 metallophosphatase family protein [Dissulfurispira thermophila]